MAVVMSSAEIFNVRGRGLIVTGKCNRIVEMYEHLFFVTPDGRRFGFQVRRIEGFLKGWDTNIFDNDVGLVARGLPFTMPRTVGEVVDDAA